MVTFVAEATGTVRMIVADQIFLFICPRTENLAIIAVYYYHIGLGLSNLVIFCRIKSLVVRHKLYAADASLQYRCRRYLEFYLIMRNIMSPSAIIYSRYVVLSLIALISEIFRP